MKISIFSPEKKIFDSVECDSVSFYTTEGTKKVLSGHAEESGILDLGICEVFGLKDLVDGTKAKSRGLVTYGFYRIKDDVVTLLAETFEWTQEIDVARAVKAQKAAESALADRELSPDLFAKYQLKLQRALIRQQSANNALH